MDDILQRWRFPIIGILLLITVSGAAVLFVRWPRAPEVTVSAPTTRSPSLRVAVSGAVVQPGVYAFYEGDRVQEALAAAGGPTADADLDKLNLAQRLRDEGQVVVPRRAAQAAAPDEAATPADTGQRSGTVSQATVNINTASAAALEALPGIGPVYAQRIIEHRTKNGPFQHTGELKDKKLVPNATYDKIKDLIDVK